MEINEEKCKSFVNRRKVMKFWIIILQFHLNKKKKKKLLTLHVSCEKKKLFNQK